MSKLIFREFKMTDFKDLCNLIDSTWNLNRFIGNSEDTELATEIFLFTSLYSSTYTQVVEEDGKAVGLLFGRIDKELNFVKKSKYGFIIIGKLIKFLFNRNEKLSLFYELIKRARDLTYIPRNLKKTFDGEVTLFVLDSSCRGKGIGKSLMNNFINVCRDKKLNKIYVFTDTECNYGFYEAYDFKRIRKRNNKYPMKDGELNTEDYMYSLML
ncbi:acetyltransferase [Gottschalkia purinilytica]|uniref:Acetyltransferase n=1 Tax=Gottschalkia purinilytica TaxID=1503 RepID=A0A0L0W883_GOTPU|nr:GNAT family N-acetyltransferase [Gottschalkia purinilytica]KNF07656.1 acetyltransferase [Gottschalkia purinilytica]